MRAFTRGKKAEPACISVHAGAGYHSLHNQAVHLQACVDAASAGMRVLRTGGCAEDAVEIAIKILEDREITNAGYGSNLPIDGHAECDAIMIDHLGRSGACGAVAQIKNPVSLARIILDGSTKELSLRRVPPNLLVGQGATDYAHENDMPVLPHDALISPGAFERWRRWRSDLEAAQRRSSASVPGSYNSLANHLFPDPSRRAEKAREIHTASMELGVWNDAQPLSPSTSEPDPALDSSSRPNAAKHFVAAPIIPAKTSAAPYNGIDLKYGHETSDQVASSSSPINIKRAQLPVTTLDGFRFRPRQPYEDDHVYYSPVQDAVDVSNVTPVWHDGAKSDAPLSALPALGKQTARPSIEHHKPNKRSRLEPAAVREDNITDTVGCIAIDNDGNIACGASSGGIGMKHRGRIGPAALVGVGASIIPVNPSDGEKTCVAVVTSGTGEHMSTTTAGSVFAERLYSNIKKTPTGTYERVEDDDEIIKSVIQTDFMGHPSVKSSISAGAIGSLLVKRTTEGTCLYFAHNTDSFAVASQSSDDSRPVCTMSRSVAHGVVKQGGRFIRARRT